MVVHAACHHCLDIDHCRPAKATTLGVLPLNMQKSFTCDVGTPAESSPGANESAVPIVDQAFEPTA